MGLASPGFELSYFGSGNGNKMSAAKTVGSQDRVRGIAERLEPVPVLVAVDDVQQQLPAVGGRVRAGAAAAAADGVWHRDRGAGGVRAVAQRRLVPVVADPAVDVAVKYNGAPRCRPDVWDEVHKQRTGTACTDVWQNVPAAGTETGLGRRHLRRVPGTVREHVRRGHRHGQRHRGHGDAVGVRRLQPFGVIPVRDTSTRVHEHELHRAHGGADHGPRHDPARRAANANDAIGQTGARSSCGRSTASP